ncbi:hypothetical protein HBI56_072200 [Parastagonospora nodorum]|uniref:Uncharacterized protein n=1 Tax=Phaeosphaeria nodorum (strain SN15 / ATCC MYA-4574 / FGSC 10173) TaxID=321614 RepID=A0A7U2EX40_PHANO|nr:hypothetical protein HBH56_172790 [Parastagonospora nodorum]QRC94629.1 hypothetical protein JI435_078540 [Parastagonospora nodorum SN15]KAH3928388.1 hypothetical protein HBH54_141350 [Parastagonospora nodorum]KAH3945264.1 hypothetical protein HBH53_146870 [Parastagonospora nodorum]KAH4142495.1 hypothetical protein HBH45_048940 [Parastagonospora nodorum]
MASFQVFGALVLALFVYLVKTIWNSYSSPISKLPGPWYSRFTKIVLGYHIVTGRRMYYIDDLHRKYGGVVRITPREVAIADMTGVTQIHKIGSGFTKSSFYDMFNPTVTGSQSLGLFAMRDPHGHGVRRKFFARPFSNSSIKQQWGAQVVRKAELAVTRMKEEAIRAQNGADIFKWWTLMATDVIAHISFGESFHVIETGTATPYIKAIQMATFGAVLRSGAPLVHKVLRYMPIKRAQEISKADEVIFEHGSIALKHMRGDDGNTMNVFGQMIEASDNSEKSLLTGDDVREEAKNFIVAGSDTTAVTLTYLIWAVLKNPEVQHKLEEELAKLGDELDLTELETAPILNSIILETLRLYSAAPGSLPRDVPSQGMVVSGYHIPAGFEVSTQAYTTHRDPSVWPNPLHFDGLRFLNTPMTVQQKAAYMPFGGGSRVCIGIHLAWMEIRIGAALFFRHCRGARLSDCMNDDIMEMDNRFLVAPKGKCCYVTLR